MKKVIFSEVSRQMVGGGRSSNLELYRIVCMLLIVAHHLVVHSGVRDELGAMSLHPYDPKTFFLLLCGMWGKVGINCFLLITGYFMCTQHITKRKLLKLFVWIYTYKFSLFFIFSLFGKEECSILRLCKLILPFWHIQNSFVPCYLLFWLTIPYLNILIRSMKHTEYLLLLLLLLGVYTIWGSNPFVIVDYNYIVWFGVVYLIGAYIRLYPMECFAKHLWGWATIASMIIACLFTVVIYTTSNIDPWFFTSDCNKILAVVISVCSFLWFKNMKMGYKPIINYIAVSTFGVLLIHDGSEVMRCWLWKELIPINSIYYQLSFFTFMSSCICTVIALYIVCTIIDRIRIKAMEEPLFNLYNKQH